MEHKMAKQPSRPVRWAEAVTAAQNALSALDSALDEFRDLRTEYEEWRDGLPENLQEGPTAELLNNLIDEAESQFDEWESNRDGIESAIEEIGALELPRGFGRD
jgi:hypothetical protein